MIWRAIISKSNIRRNKTEILHSRNLKMNSVRWMRFYHRDIHREPYGDDRERSTVINLVDEQEKSRKASYRSQSKVLRAKEFKGAQRSVSKTSTIIRGMGEISWCLQGTKSSSKQLHFKVCVEKLKTSSWRSKWDHSRLLGQAKESGFYPAGDQASSMWLKKRNIVRIVFLKDYSGRRYLRLPDPGTGRPIWVKMRDQKEEKVGKREIPCRTFWVWFIDS